MRKIFIIVIILLGSGLSAYAAPKMVIPETSWDFGYVPQGNSIEHFYWIKNVGDDTLRIINFNPG